MDMNTQTRPERTQERHVPPGGDHRSLIDLIKELRDETTTMVRQEVALAKSEASEKVSRVGRNAAYIVVGGAIAYAGFLFMMVAAMYGIAIALAEMGLSASVFNWLAPLIIGVVVAVVGYALIQKGISTIRNESPTPEKTMHSLQENKEWIAHKTK